MRAHGSKAGRKSGIASKGFSEGQAFISSVCKEFYVVRTLETACALVPFRCCDY